VSGCETPIRRLAPLGVYVFSRSGLGYVLPNGYQDIKETLIPRLYAANEAVRTYVVPGPGMPRVTNAAAYLAVNQWAVERLAAGDSLPDGYVRIQDALIHESARLHATARFIGPVQIGPRCHIEEDASIVGPTTLGAGCVVGRQAVVSRSVLWSSCRVGAGAVLDHCILTDMASVEAQLVLREKVCLARPPCRTWTDHIRMLLQPLRPPKRVASFAPSKGSAFLPTRKDKGAIPVGAPASDG
jgi:NDP-sugar pyrophosphorylase family protein